MAVEIVMPKLGMSMKEGSVSLWNKKVGDPVSKGDYIAGISSEKIETDLEAPVDGTLIEIKVQEGEGVPPGTAICYIGQPGEKVNTDPTPKTESVEAKDEVAATMVVEKKDSKQAEVKGKTAIKASPVAKKIAEKAGLKLDEIKGTGPGGRITKEDVMQAIEHTKQGTNEEKEKQQQPQDTIATPIVRKTPVTGMRKVIASRMHNSLSHSAQLTIQMKADVTDLLSLQKKLQEAAPEEVKLSLTDFISRAAVIALKKHPNMNSAYINDHIESYESIHLGMAVALENGLIVPVIRHAEKCSLVDLSKQIKSLAQQARAGELNSDQMTGSTFTITNLGSYGVDHFTPILNPPESGILGVGATNDIPVYIGDELQRRTILPLSLTFDHRVLDGAPAAEFLRTVKQLLEQTYRILL